MHSARTTRWRRWIVFVVMLVVVPAGAAISLPYLIFRPMPTMVPATDASAGTLIHVVGWNGAAQADRDLLFALRDAGCGMSMETFDWTNGQRSLIALWRAQHSREPSAQLAERIKEIHRSHPNRKIFMTADSSGCGVALTAIASLPDEVRIQALVLSSPAVSSTYDLVPALRHIDGKLISFNSDRDFLILCVGTRVFGTVDGYHTSGAGRVGFVVPIDRAGYAKLRQVSYDPAWQDEYGNSGSHAQALTPRFAKAMIAPLLKDASR